MDTSSTPLKEAQQELITLQMQHNGKKNLGFCMLSTNVVLIELAGSPVLASLISALCKNK